MLSTVSRRVAKRSAQKTASFSSSASSRAAASASANASANARPLALALAATGALACGIGAAAMEPNPKPSCKPRAMGPIPVYGVAGTLNERTFIAIKPDGVQRLLIAEVIARFEKKGFKLVGLKMISATKEQAGEHYAELETRPFYKNLVQYFVSGPVICMVWEGPDVIQTGRKILGATNPNAAAPGTLRGDNCVSTGRNLVHGSDGAETAKREISLWFIPEEINEWERDVEDWLTGTN